MQTLRRWGPLLGTAVLVVTTVLRVVGEGQAAAAVEALGATFGLTGQSPIGPQEFALVAATLSAAASSAWGLYRKLSALWRETGRGGMDGGRLAAAAVIGALAFASGACTDTPGPTAPESVNVTINNNQNQNNGNANQSPTGPGAPSCEAVRYVELAFTLGGNPSTTIPPGGTGTVTARALSASRAPITEGRCLPAPTWAKTGQCDLAGDAGAYTRTLTARTGATGSCGLDVTVSEAQGTLSLRITQ